MLRRLGTLLLVVAAMTVVVAPSPGAAVADVEPLQWLSTGDSYSSGEGVPGNRGACAQSDRAWGHVAAANLGAGLSVRDPLVFTACTGHLVGDHYNPREDADGKGSFWEWAKEQTSEQDPKFDVITLTFGGNDLDFGGIIKDCSRLPDSWTSLANPLYAYGDCDVDEDELRDRVAALTAEPDNGGAAKCAAVPDDCATADARFSIDEAAGVTGSLATFYSTLAERHLTPRGRIVVVTYPRLFAPSGEWKARYGLRCAGFTRDDANMLGRIAEYLDTVIRQQVGRANDRLGRDAVEVVSAVDLFGGRDGQRDSASGKELCGNGEDWLNGWWLDGTGTFADASFHPHEKGHAAQGRAVARLVTGLDWQPLLTQRHVHQGTLEFRLPEDWTYRDWCYIVSCFSAVAEGPDGQQVIVGEVLNPDDQPYADFDDRCADGQTVDRRDTGSSSAQLGGRDGTWTDVLLECSDLPAPFGGVQCEDYLCPPAGTAARVFSSDAYPYDITVLNPDAADVDAVLEGIRFLAPAIGADTRIDLRGAGPIEAGMTGFEAETAAQVTLDFEQAINSDGCFQVYPAEVPGLAIMFSGDWTYPREAIVQRVSTSRFLGPDGGESTVPTRSGLAIGDPEARITELYGDLVRRLGPAPYDPEGSEWEFTPTAADNEPYRMRVIVESAGTVSEIRSGLAGPVSWMEGCS